MANIVSWIDKPIEFDNILNIETNKFTIDTVSIVELDGPSVNTYTDIYADPRCPKSLEPSPHVPFGYYVQIRIEKSDSVPNIYKVTATSSNSIDISESDKVTLIEDPTKRPIRISRTSHSLPEIKYFDNTGKPFCTTAGEPIIHQEEVKYPLFSLEKNMKIINPLYQTVTEFVNKDSVRFLAKNYAPRTILFVLKNISELQLENEVYFRTMSFDLLINPNTWDIKKRNAGYMARFKRFNQNSGKYDTVYGPIKVGDPPQNTTTPIPLTKNGFVPSIFLARDPATKQPIIDPDSLSNVADTTVPSINFDKLLEVWKNSELSFRTKPEYSFRNLVPLS